MSTKYKVHLQNVSSISEVPNRFSIQRWVNEVLADERDHAELTIRIVDEEESQQLNRDYRGKDKPTNVLSFGFELPDEVDESLLGDLIICAQVVMREATEQEKAQEAHWAHMIIHGILHLLGYDHENDADADVMESKEIAILARLDFPNPYTELEGDPT